MSLKEMALPALAFSPDLQALRPIATLLLVTRRVTTDCPVSPFTVTHRFST
jgi:hypothetical protein